MDSNACSMWSNIVKKDPPSKPSPNDKAPAAIPGTVGNCKSTKGISTAVVDASAIIEGGQSLTIFADKLVTVREVLLYEIRDLASRCRLAFIPLTTKIETREPSLESLRKVTKFAGATGDLQTMSKVDIKLIALTYELEAQVHGTKNLRDVPPPIQTVRAKRSPEKELLGWDSNVANLEEWEALAKETKVISNANDVASVLSHTEHQEEDEQEGDGKHRRFPPKKTEVKLKGKMVVEGLDASHGQYDDEDSGDWTLAVSINTRRKFLRRKARWEHYNALAEQEIQQDQEADKAGNMIVDTADLQKQSNQSCAKGEATLINGENNIENQELEENMEIASSVADDGSSEQSRSLRALSESSVACITGDYAMQNVILQMGLRLLAPGGKQIRQLNRWVWKCHACNTVTPEIRDCHACYTVKFCPKCGNGGTLHKVPVTIDENGTTIPARKPRITLRGTKFSIPMPKGGRDAITKNLVLREDQVPRKFLHSKTKKKTSKPGDEYFVSENVFLNHHSDKKAPLQPPVRKTIALFSQKRNPNDIH